MSDSIKRILFLDQRTTLGKSFEIYNRVYRHIKSGQNYYRPLSRFTLVLRKRNMDKTDRLFNAKLDAFDGAKVCELISNFLLYKLSQRYEPKNLALYRDHFLAVFKHVSGPASEKIGKLFCKVLDEHEIC